MDAVSRSVGDGAIAVVEYDYTAKEADELDLVKGALICNIKQLPGGWWEGTLKSTGKTGMFPDNFVRLVEINDENAVVLRDKSAITNRRCKVIYSYTQVNDDELSLTVGDVIDLLGEVEEGWWRGSLKSKVGVFPSNFVVTIEPTPIFASKRPPSTSLATTATATSSFTSSNAATSSTRSNAVSVSSGASPSKKLNRSSPHSSKEDLLSLTNNNKIVAATKTAGDDIAPSLPPKPQREFCRVEFPYMPQNEDELYLRAGDIITLISMELPDKGWWKGELRGKVGVFPDNFVKLLPSEACMNDTHFTNRVVKNSIPTADTASTTTLAAHSTTVSSGTKTNHVNNSKVFAKKSGSSSSTHSSQGQAAKHKDSFGSRDSLNDILSETGLQCGNVAAARKSLENKNIDLVNVSEAGRLAMRKAQQETVPTAGATVVCSSSNLSASTVCSNSEIRKSLENLEEKTKNQPPVLSKKPLLGAKGILSGLKQKVKNVEKQQLTTSAIHDYTDGVAASKTSPSCSGLPEAGVAGNVIMRRSATIAVENIDFDSVERTSILPDMRAGRVKAPRRRPPSVAYNAAGESNNNNTVYLNGSGGDAVPDESVKLHSSDDNSTGDEQSLAKPKPREWQTQKAPWMEELKLSQVKKKASPNVEPRSVASTTNETEIIKVSVEEAKNSSSSPRAFSTSTSSSSSVKITTSKVQASSVSTSMHQSVAVESHQHPRNKSVMATKCSLDSSEDTRMRPNSLSIRNCSLSPTAGRKSAKSIGIHDPSTINAAMEADSNNSTFISSNATLLTNSHTAPSTSSSVQENNPSVLAKHSQTLSNTNCSPFSTNANSNDSKEETKRVLELEQRVEKLEFAVLAQQRAIDELVCTLREESDRVKLLRGELEKYAQCVTQV